jgi:hypothetical protein
MIKLAYIKKINKETWRVYSQKGKNLGTFKSLKQAKKRLKDVEFFKQKEKITKNARVEFYEMLIFAEKDTHKHHHHHKHHHDEDKTYSAYLRDINKNNPEKVKEVMSKFKKIFDQALMDNTPLDEIESVCLLELTAKEKLKVEDE